MKKLRLPARDGASARHVPVVCEPSPGRRHATASGLHVRRWSSALHRFGGAVLLSLVAAQAAHAGLGASVTIKSGEPTQIYPGEVTVLQIELSNNNDLAPITNVSFSKALSGSPPNGLRVAGVPTYTCTDPATGLTASGVGVLTAVQGTQTLELSGGAIPARYAASSTDGSCLILIPVTAGTSDGAAATYALGFSAGDISGNDGSAVANIGEVQQNVPVRALVQPVIGKQFSNGTVVLGGSASRLTITLDNPNPVALPDFEIEDVFPQLGGAAIIEIASTPNLSMSCSSGPSPVLSAGGGAGDTVLAATGTVPANGSCTLAVDVVARHTNNQYSTGARTNRIGATSGFSNGLGIRAQADATANITARSPLRMTKVANADALVTGGVGYFTVTLFNDGNTPLTLNQLTDSPIDGISGGGYGLAVIGSSTSCGGTLTTTASAEGVELSGATIPANGSCVLRIDFEGSVAALNTPIEYTNTIAANAVDVATPGVVAQGASSSVTVYQNLDVLKSVATSNAAPGNPVRYQVTVRNWADTAANDLTVTDALGSGQTYLTGTIGGNDYTPTLTGAGCGPLNVTGATGDATPVFTIGAVPARPSINAPGACVLTFWVMTPVDANDGQGYANQIPAGAVCHAAGTICNGAPSQNVSGTVNAEVLALAKAFAAPVIRPEGQVTRLTLTLSNRSANPLSNLAVSDTLPTSSTNASQQLRIANPANAATTCGGAVITAVPGSTSLGLSGGSVPARADKGSGALGTCQVQVDAVGPSGVFDNTATATATQILLDNSELPVSATSNTARLTYTSALSAAKSFLPAAVSDGGRSRVRIRLENSSGGVIGGLRVSDPLPAGMLVAAPPNAYTSCAGPSSVTAVAGSSSVLLEGAELGANGSCDLVFDVIVTGHSDWVNVIPVGGISADGGLINQTPVSATLQQQTAAGMTVSKSSNPSTLTFPGQVSELTIEIQNGLQAVSGLALDDYFTVGGTEAGVPNGMVIAANPAATTTCPSATVSAVPGATRVGLTGVSLAANAACVIKVNVSSTAIGGITNTIPAGAVRTDQGVSNGGPAATSLSTQSNVGLTKQFLPKVVKPGERSRLRITFFNPVEQPMAGISVMDTMPAGVTIPGGANPATTCVGAQISVPAPDRLQISGGTLGAASGGIAASCQVEIDVVVTAQGAYQNTIPAGAVAATLGGVPVSNSQPASDDLIASAPLRITKAFGGRTRDSGNPEGFTTGTLSTAPGAAVLLTLRLSNPGALALTGVGVIDSLPAGVVLATPLLATTNCANAVIGAVAAGTQVQLSGASIPAGGACDLSVEVVSNMAGSHVNQVPAGAVVSEQGVSNEEPTHAELVITALPTIAKEFTPAVIAPSGLSTLTLMLGNDNLDAITLTADLVDVLPGAPGQMRVAATPNVGGTCPGVVSAIANATSVTYPAGAVIPAGGCRITVDVTASVQGHYINSIAAGELRTSIGNNPSPANAGLEVSTLGYISGRVFRDNDVLPDGLYTPAVDTPIAGSLIELRSGNDCSGPLLAAVTSDVLGNYLFSGLSAGSYTLCQPSQPDGTVNGAVTAGVIVPLAGSAGTPGHASNPSATSSRVAGIVLGADGGNVSGSSGNDFAEIATSVISGKVFLDHNNNGVMNGADLPIGGVEIVLSGTDINSSPVTRTTVTDADGQYRFDDLLPGSYTISQPTQPPATANGMTIAGAVGNGGAAGLATPQTAVVSAISNIVLPPNTVAGGNDFAEIPQAGRIEGRVFLDYDNNGSIDSPNDHGLGGVLLELSGVDINGNPISRTSTTAADGSYAFSGLPSGTYTVNQPAQPAGTSNGQTTAGTHGGVASNPTASSSRIEAIVIEGTNPVSANNNFAERPGDVPDLTLSKVHSPASFAAGGTTGFYTLTVGNISPETATSGEISVSDTLPAGLLPTSAYGPGWSCVIATQTVTCSTMTSIAALASAEPIIVRVAVDAGLAGQVPINVATVSGGGEPPGFAGNNTAEDPTPISAAASVAGSVWRDLDSDRQRGLGEPGVTGWRVELLYQGLVVATATTDEQGRYVIGGIAPGDGYQLRFVEPSTGQVFGSAVANEQGLTANNGVRDDPTQAVTTNSGNPAGATLGDGTLTNLSLFAGDNILEQSLPLDPAGVVYDAVTRQPVAGAVVTISGPAGFDPATHLVGGSASVLTTADGLYQFLLRPGSPAGSYALAVTTYPAAYLPQPSEIIPACSVALVVGGVPEPAAVQSGANPPLAGAPAHDPGDCPSSSAMLSPANQATTQYYMSFVLDVATSANVINNHIPLDPILGGAIRITKTTPMVNVSKGGLVPYTITATNTMGVTLAPIDVVDQLPAGFRYRSGSGSVRSGGSSVFVAAEPSAAGAVLRWGEQIFAAGETKTYRLVLLVGAGVGEGEYTNLAWAMNGHSSSRVSNIGSAVVRVIPDPLFDCSEIIGKVFDDKNANGYQDDGEPGIPNVRVVTARGLLVTSDAEGRFHVACADIPQRDRGSNFVMKLDERTLPSGYRVTTENPRDVRTTRGKMVKLNFGATVHKVFRIEFDERAFEGETLAPGWDAQLHALLPQLAERPAVARLAYRAAKGAEAEAEARLDALARHLRERYRAGNAADRPPLIIETEITGVASGAQGEQQ